MKEKNKNRAIRRLWVLLFAKCKEEEKKIKKKFLNYFSVSE
jgi:hypothetical protein